jgi:hypothetical protein
MGLTAHRTLALRDAVADNPHVALTAPLHKLVVDAFQRASSAGGCLEVSRGRTPSAMSCRRPRVRRRETQVLPKRQKRRGYVEPGATNGRGKAWF